jgi:two-component system sensor histidine kinase KdpD
MNRRQQTLPRLALRDRCDHNDRCMADQRTSAEPHGWDIKGLFIAILATAIATAVGWPLYHGLSWPDASRSPRFSNINVLMIYLLGVLWVAVRHSRMVAIICSVLAVAAFDFVFVPPYLTFNVADQQYILTFAVMLVTALTISTLTHRVRRQSEEARAAWERVEIEFLRNTLLSGVSHELRTPLASITGAATTLVEAEHQLSREARADLLETLIGEAERMERLITNLLDMTRLEAGGLSLKREWQPLQEVIGSTLHNLDRRISNREIKLNIPADLPLLHIDALAIEQVVTNLIDNALEYTPRESPIEINARADEREILVEICDRGPGLPAGAEGRVFDKFFRAAQSSGHRGIGLGLAICRGVIEAHGGGISAANRPGGGSVFTFTLPLSQPPPAIDEDG